MKTTREGINTASTLITKLGLESSNLSPQQKALLELQIGDAVSFWPSSSGQKPAPKFSEISQLSPSPLSKIIADSRAEIFNPQL